jgi:hypothetical protein
MSAYVDQNFGDGSSDAYIVNGLGPDGADALDVLERVAPGKWLFLVSRNVEDFKVLDGCGRMGDPRVVCQAGPELGPVQDALKKFIDASEAFEIQILTPPGENGTSQFQLVLADALGSAINQRQVDINTLFVHADRLTLNGIRNLQQLRHSQPVGNYLEALQGVPAAVVASGPSLNDALPILREYRDRMLIVSVGKSFKLLVKEGIDPHIVAQLDMAEGCMKFYEGAKIHPDTTLFWDGDCWPEVPELWKGPKIVSDCGIAVWEWARRFDGGLRTVDWKAQTVAHTSLHLARLMGCSPLMLVGVDLAFPGEQTHAEGVTHTWGGKLNAFPETKYVEVNRVGGGTVRTLPNMRSYITGFEIIVANTKQPIIQTSPAGAKIRGTVEMPLKQVAEQYCGDKRDVAGLLKAAHAKPSEWDADDFDYEIKRLRNELQAVEKMCVEGKRHIWKMKNLDPMKGNMVRKYAKNEKFALALRASVLENKSAFAVLRRVVSVTSTHMRDIGKEIEKAGKERTKIELSADLLEEFFTGFERAAKLIGEEIDKLLLTNDKS